MSTLFYPLTDVWVLSYTSPDAHPGTLVVSKPITTIGDSSVLATSLVVPPSGVYGLRLRNGSETVWLYMGEYLGQPPPSNSIQVPVLTAPVSLVLVGRADVPAAYLTPTVGTATTPDPGPLPAECIFVFKVRQDLPYVGAHEPAVVSQDMNYEGGRSWIICRTPFAQDVWVWYQWPDATGSGYTSTNAAVTAAPPTGLNETWAVSVDQNDAGVRRMRSFRPDGVGGWTPLDAGNTAVLLNMYDASSVVRIGSSFDASGGNAWRGRIYSVELRAGLDPAVGGNTMSVPGYVTFPNTAGNYLSVPDAANLKITGDLTIVARVQLRDWTPAVSYDKIIGKGTDYAFTVLDSGGLWFLTTLTSGTANASPWTAFLGFPDGSWQWVAVTHDVDNGAGGNDIRFFTSPDGVTWTLSALRTGTGVAVRASSASEIQIGGGDFSLDGSISHVSVRSGIGVAGAPGGTEVFRLDTAADLMPSLSPSATSFLAGSGQTVTVNRSAGDPKTTLVPTTTGVIWRFDANEYPGTGTSYVDPRGRTWTLASAAAITPRTVTEVTGSYSLDGLTWTTAGTAEMAASPTFGDLYFDQFSTIDSISASFQNFRVLAGTTALPYPAKHTFFNPIGGDDAVQPPALTPSQEAVIHALVGAQFGDLEFDIGKSVRWTQYFADDVFITDVNYGDPRYWIIDWAQTFPYVNYKTAGGGVSFFDDPVTFRKTQFADAEQFARDNEEALVFDNNDWVLWVDAHEGLSVDNTPPFPDDYDFDLFRSYVAREIRAAIEAGKDRIILPFYVYVRHDHIQNVEYDWIPNQAEGGNKCVQSMGVPYYIPYRGLLRLMKVSVLRNPAFDWTSIDQPSAFPADEGVEEPHLATTVGTASAVDAADLNILTDVRFTAKIRDDSTESTTTRIIAAKSLVTTSYISWRFGVTYLTGFNVQGFPQGTPSPATTIIAPSRTAMGLTPPGQDIYVKGDIAGVGQTTAATMQARLFKSTDGTNWTSVSTGGFVAANAMSNDSASPLLIGQGWQGRIYWAQLERINQRRFIYAGPTTNYLTTPGAPFDSLNGKITFIFQVAPDDWTTTYQGLISRRGPDPTNSFDILLRGAADRIPALSFYVYSDGTIANRWQAFSTAFPVAGVDGQPLWFAVTYEHDNGAAGRTVRFFSSPDGVTWTIVGTPQTAAGVFPPKVGTVTPVQFGIIAGSFPFKGRFMRATVSNGVGAAGVPGGAPVFELRETDAAGWTTGTFPSSSPRYIRFPGTAGNYASVPDAANLDLVNDLTMIAKVSLDDWTPAVVNFLYQKGPSQSPGGVAYGLQVATNGAVQALFGTATISGAVNTQILFANGPIAPPADGTAKWIAFTLDADDGAGNRVARWFESVDGTTWTAWGTPTTTVGNVTLAVNAHPITFGGRPDGAAPLLGNLYYASIRSGIGAAGVPGGTEVFRFDSADLGNAVPTAASFTAGTGQTVTVNRSAGDPKTDIVSALVTPSGTVVQVAPDEVAWRFDAKEYPGTGTSYVDPRGRTWTLTNAAALVPYDQPEVRLQVVSYGYAHWNLQDIPPGASGVPTLNAENDLGWRQRNLLSKMRPVPGLPYGDTWQFPNADTPGLAGPWAPDTFENQVTGVVIPEARPPIDPLVASVRVPLYDSVLRLNTRDGVWYSGDGSGNVPLEWDEESQSWKPPVTQEQQVT